MSVLSVFVGGCQKYISDTETLINTEYNMVCRTVGHFWDRVLKLSEINSKKIDKHY